MIEIPKIVEEKFSSRTRPVVAIVDGYVKEDSASDKRFIPTKCICSCDKGINEIQNAEPIEIRRGAIEERKCKHCGALFRVYHPTDFSSEKVYNMVKSASRYYYGPKKPVKSYKNEDTIYFRKHPTKDGIECYIGHIMCVIDDSDEDNVKMTKTLNVTHYASIVPGEPVYSVKVLKRSNKEVDLFKAFNINSQIGYGKNCVFEDSNNFTDFFDNNLEFFKRNGMFELLKNGDGLKQYNPVSFFLVYLALNQRYPVLELLIKMGYTKMYLDIFKKVLQAGSKVAIQDNVAEMNKLLSQSTKGSLALRIPQYIGTYLRDKSSDLKEYLNWCDIYEIENISKENFEKIVNSTYYFSCLNSRSLEKIADVMKYGYTFESLLKYLHKYQKKYEIDVNERYYYWSHSSDDSRHYANNLNLLRDYLEMCDLMDIRPDRTPQNIKKVHDEVSKAYKAKENEQNDKKFKELAQAVKEYTKKDEDAKKTKMEEEYEIILPESTYDFIREGQQQHNCVGSYCRNVLNGHCVIFFVRKKDDPEESYITAEYRNGYLGQVMYKNNIPVKDDDMINFCRVFCNKIKRGIENGKIPKYSPNRICA